MIFGTYFISGTILAISAFLFVNDALSALTQTLLWVGSFFFASAGASAAYLTVSEIFPLEVRGQAISYFFSIGQLVGATGPTIYGALIGDGKDRVPLFYGYLLGAGVMIFGGLIAWFFGVNAEGQSLEDVADPLSRVDTPPPREPAAV
jgi:MFS family permease